MNINSHSTDHTHKDCINIICNGKCEDISIKSLKSLNCSYEIYVENILMHFQ